MVKTCSKCKIEKESSDFPIDKRRIDGHSPHCKKCRYELIKDWRKRNPIKTKAIRDRYDSSEKGKEKNIARGKEYRKSDNFKYSWNKWRYNNKIKFNSAQSIRNKRYLKKQVDELGDFYIKRSLMKQGFPPIAITKEIIEIKKLIIKTKRATTNHENENRNAAGRY